VLTTRDALDLDAEVVQRALHGEGSCDHAYGARQGLGLGQDAVGAALPRGPRSVLAWGWLAPCSILQLTPQPLPQEP
jgi:hypothetical protein